MYTHNLRTRFHPCNEQIAPQTFVREHDRTRTQSVLQKSATPRTDRRTWHGGQFVYYDYDKYLSGFEVEQKHRLVWEQKPGKKILFYTKDLFSN